MSRRRPEPTRKAMRIFLVRHGESLGNVDKSVHAKLPDHAISLSERGREQARAAGAFLANYCRGTDRIRIWTSPYRRTRETAQHIFDALERYPVDIREHFNLCEQQFGLFDGISDEDLPHRFPQEHAYYAMCEEHEGRFWARMPLGERRFDVAIRIHQAFGTFHRDAERHDIRNLIVICHGVSLRAFVMQWLHLTPEWFDQEPNPGNAWIRLVKDDEDRGYIYRGPGASSES